MHVNPVYTIPVIALSIAAFTGFNAAVIALLALGVITGILTFCLDAADRYEQSQ